MINIVKYAGTEKGFICDGKHLIIIPSWKSLYVYFSSIFFLLSDDQVVSGLPRGVVTRFVTDSKHQRFPLFFFSDSTHSRAAWAGNSTLKNRLSTRCTISSLKGLSQESSTMFSLFHFNSPNLSCCRSSEWLKSKWKRNHRKKKITGFCWPGEQVAWNKRAHLLKSNKRTNIGDTRYYALKTNFSTNSA